MTRRELIAALEAVTGSLDGAVSVMVRTGPLPGHPHGLILAVEGVEAGPDGEVILTVEG